MNDQPDTGESHVPPPQQKKTSDDLSSEVERAVDREPRDRVRCVRLFDTYYRCNWWAPMNPEALRERGFDWAVATTHHVRKSLFLNVKINSGRLVIEQVTPAAH